VMHRFMVQAFQDAPFCSSTAEMYWLTLLMRQARA
jgi:hypothetical protein